MSAPPVSLVPGDRIEAWADDEVAAWFAEAGATGVPAPTSLAMEAHVPRLLRGFGRLWWATYRGGALEPPLMERVRAAMAGAAGCTYCASSGPAVAPPDPDAALGRLAPAAPDDLVVAAAVALAGDPGSLDASAARALDQRLGPAALAELLGFMAWQATGPRMLRAWGASAWKPGPRVDPATLPVRLPWAERAWTGPREARSPAVTPPAASLRARAAGLGWHAAWVEGLLPRADVLAAWLDLAEAVRAPGPLGPEILTPVIAVLTGGPGLPPPGHPAATAVAWASSLGTRGEVEDDLAGRALAELGDAGVVHLGFLVAATRGPALVGGWLAGRPGRLAAPPA